MTAAADKRKLLKDELLKVEEKKRQERNQLASEYQDVALADEIVNKRRNKSLRRGSNPSSSTSPSSPNNAQKVSRRQSAVVNGNRSKNANTTSSLNSEEDSRDNPIHNNSSPETVTVEAEGIHSSIPPQYQKLLQLGLSQEQVWHISTLACQP